MSLKNTFLIFLCLLSSAATWLKASQASQFLTLQELQKLQALTQKIKIERPNERTFILSLHSEQKTLSYDTNQLTSAFINGTLLFGLTKYANPTATQPKRHCSKITFYAHDPKKLLTEADRMSNEDYACLGCIENL